MAKKVESKKLRVTLVKSPIGYTEAQKRTVRALGLRRMNQTVEHTDSPALRGMLQSIVHMIKIEE
jgi:large subunit ribosomal protein L30